MKKTFNMWRMTRDLEKKTLKLHKDHVKSKFGEIEIQKMERTVYLQDFAKRKRMTDYQAYGIYEDCDKKYIQTHKRDNNLKLLRVKRGEGTDLIDTVFGFPNGLVEALWKKHGRFISGFIIGLIIPLSITGIKLVFFSN